MSQANIKVVGVKTKDGYKTLDHGLTVDSALFNGDAGFGTALDKTNTTVYSSNTTNKNYPNLANMYQYWLPRKVVDLIPNIATRGGWKHNCPSLSPEQLQELEKVDRDLKVVNKFNKAWKWDRLFGGSLVVFLFDQSMGLYSEAIDPATIKKGSLIGIDVYDPWQAHAATIEFNDITSTRYRKPSSFNLGSPGFLINRSKNDNPSTFADGALVSSTRTVEMTGLDLPWFTFQNNYYWGQSLVASVYEALQNADIVTASVSQLLFKLSIPVFKTKDLTAIVSDDIASGAFMKRMTMLNTMMSNNHMAVIDSEEELANLEQTALTSLDSVIARFLSIVAMAADIPVTQFTGEQASGIGNAQEGDEKAFYSSVEAKREEKLLPALNRFYDVLFPAVFGIERPSDHKIEFPPLFVETKKAKADREAVEISNLEAMLNMGVINERIAIEEIIEKEIVSNITEEDKSEILGELFVDPEDIEEASELEEDLSGAYE